ncbi:MAG: 6-phosphogluconolactonase [Nitrospirae bacterium]|nr:6-phosphogluconolactonase [Nitrospirota bacterium]
MVREVLIFKDDDEMAEFVIEKWKEISQAAIQERGYFTAALSGGKSPAVLYQKLSWNKTLPWGMTHIFMVDERFVPYENDWNNHRMINRTLLRHIPILPKNIHPILTSDTSPEDVARKYEEELNAFFKKWHVKLPGFDLVLLGIGEDGHTASLFPDSTALQETKRLAIPVPQSQAVLYERITITFPLINNSENIMFFVSGSSKAKIVKDVIEGGNISLPAAMVRPEKGKLCFLLDEGAASLLKQKKI